MLKKIILYCFIYGALYSQVILHQPEESTFSDAPLYIEVFSDFNYSEIASFDIFYRSNNEEIYIKDRFTYLSNNDFSYTIKPNFLNGQYIEYYFLIEMKDGSIDEFLLLDIYDKIFTST